MREEPLYKGKKFTSWTIGRVAEVLCDELKPLGPKLEKDTIAYGKKITQISFKGEVNVALEITKQKHPEKDLVQVYIGLSLSPVPFDRNTHVLNTFDMGIFMGLFPELNGKHFFTIEKTEPWSDSLFSKTAQAMLLVIDAMLKIESCFHLLIDDEYEVGGIKLNMRSLSLTRHLHRVKGYRLAEIYGHPEKLNEAINAIKRDAHTDELSKQRLDILCATKSPGGMGWLYTPEMIERLCK